MDFAKTWTLRCVRPADTSSLSLSRGSPALVWSESGYCGHTIEITGMTFDMLGGPGVYFFICQLSRLLFSARRVINIPVPVICL